MPDSDRHDQLLQELLSLHRQLATIPPGDFPARHELLGRIDLVRNELAALPKPVTEVERRFIKEELRSLKKLRADYADLVVGMRWGGSVPVLEFWRRRLRRTTLEDRPSFQLTRKPGERNTAEPWPVSPNWMPFGPEMHAINERIGTLKQRLRGNRRLRSGVRKARRHRHPDDRYEPRPT